MWDLELQTHIWFGGFKTKNKPGASQTNKFLFCNSQTQMWIILKNKLSMSLSRWKRIFIQSLRTNYLRAQFSKHLNSSHILVKIYHWHLDLFLASFIWITQQDQQRRTFLFGSTSSRFKNSCLCLFSSDKILTLNPWQNDDMLSINDGFKSAGGNRKALMSFFICCEKNDMVEYSYISN